MSDSEYSVIKSDIIKIFDCTVIALRVGLEVIKLEFILNLRLAACGHVSASNQSLRFIFFLFLFRQPSHRGWWHLILKEV